MKQAVASIGKLESLVTKTIDRELAISINEFRFGEIEAEEIAFDRPHGTTISIVNVNSIFINTNSASYTRTIIPYLGARYRRFLNSPVKMSRCDQAASAVTATISTAVSASDSTRITKAIVSAA